MRRRWQVAREIVGSSSTRCARLPSLQRRRSAKASPWPETSRSSLPRCKLCNMSFRVATCSTESAVKLHIAAWCLCRVVQYVGVKSGATSAMHYKGVRCCLARERSGIKRAAICFAATAFLRCNVGTERVAIHSNVAKVTCAARRCGGKRVYMPYVAMGCIYTSQIRMVASKYILLPWGTWKGCGKRAAIWWVAARFLCCSWCSSLHDDATLLHGDAAHTALQRVARR